jgi:CheY-like chemotaxis protein
LGGYVTFEHKGSILFVDYNENNREILTRHLYGQGHSVMMAEDGRQALEMIRQSLKSRNAAGAG